MDAAEVYAALRDHSLAKPSAVEDFPWGDVGWKVKGKMFACTSENSRVVTVKSTREKQSALVMHPQIDIAKYVGRHGWVTVTVDSVDTLELAKDLIDESFDLVVGRK